MHCTYIIHALFVHVCIGTSVYIQTLNLPDKTGEKAKWNFEEAHSILHKVSEIVLWGNTNNTSCKAPEVITNVYVHMCS